MTARRTTDGSRIFRVNGQPHRDKGVSAFRLPELWHRGVDIQPFLACFPRYNRVRCWDYVTWPAPFGWDSIGTSAWHDFLRGMADLGWYVEATIYTGDEADHVEPGLILADSLVAADHDGLMIEGGNELDINGKQINEDALRRIWDWCRATDTLFSSGHFANPEKHFGSFLTNHAPRDFDAPRKVGHDLLEFFNGEGPSKKADPPHKMPCIEDEWIRPDQLLAMWRSALSHDYHDSERPDIERWFNTDLRKRDQAGLAEAMTVLDYRAGGAGCGLMGGGGLFHCESSKQCTVLTDFEQRCADAFADGLDAFPADAPLGAYRRPVEASLRTYVVGDHAVRVRPMSPDFPESGWTSLDTDGILWRSRI